MADTEADTEVSPYSPQSAHGSAPGSAQLSPNGSALLSPAPAWGRSFMKGQELTCRFGRSFPSGEFEAAKSE